MIELRTFTEEEYHQFFRHYESDPMMDTVPFIIIRNRFPVPMLTIMTDTGLITLISAFFRTISL